MCLGIPARVLSPVDLERESILVEVQGNEQTVSAAMLVAAPSELPQVGEWVVVHLGFALSKMDEAEAQTVLAGLDELHDLYAELG